MNKGEKLFRYLFDQHKEESYTDKAQAIIADLILLEDEKFDIIVNRDE